MLALDVSCLFLLWIRRGAASHPVLPLSLSSFRFLVCEASRTDDDGWATVSGLSANPTCLQAQLLGHSARFIFGCSHCKYPAYHHLAIQCGVSLPILWRLVLNHGQHNVLSSSYFDVLPWKVRSGPGSGGIAGVTGADNLDEDWHQHSHENTCATIEDARPGYDGVSLRISGV